MCHVSRSRTNGGIGSPWAAMCSDSGIQPHVPQIVHSKGRLQPRWPAVLPQTPRRCWCRSLHGQMHSSTSCSLKASLGEMVKARFACCTLTDSVVKLHAPLFAYRLFHDKAGVVNGICRDCRVLLELYGADFEKCPYLQPLDT